MNIYIKPKQKVSLSNRKEILIDDVSEVVVSSPNKNIEKNVKKLKLLSIENNKENNNNKKGKKNYLVSVTDIIKLINKSYPDYTVNNVGENDTWVQHSVQKQGQKKSNSNALLKWLKVAFVATVLMIGSSTAIMSFHTDGQLGKVFEKYYEIFYGEQKTNPAIINIPYSIGLAVGIVVFYNHFLGKKLTDDPTPIEVEMEQYDKEVAEAMIDRLEQESSGIQG